MVSHLFEPNSTNWDIAKIRAICPDYEDQILKLKLSSGGACDKLFWIGTRNGEYSTKSGYDVAMLRELEAVPTSPKVRMLVWKALNGALPTGTRLQERHINVETECKRCGSQESIPHLFFSMRRCS